MFFLHLRPAEWIIASMGCPLNLPSPPCEFLGVNADGFRWFFLDAYSVLLIIALICFPFAAAIVIVKILLVVSNLLRIPEIVSFIFVVLISGGAIFLAGFVFTFGLAATLIEWPDRYTPKLVQNSINAKDEVVATEPYYYEGHFISYKVWLKGGGYLYLAVSIRNHYQDLTIPRSIRSAIKKCVVPCVRSVGL